MALRGASHPHIVTCYGSWSEGTNGRDVPFLVMELLHGITLKDWIRDYAPASPRQFLSILMPILDGIAFLHKNKIIHRDIKPANIMLVSGQRLRPVIMDLGLAHIDGYPDVTKDYEFNATWRRAAWEYLFREPADAMNKPPVDIYALGTVAYDLITGTEFLDGIKNKAKLALAKTRKPPPSGAKFSDVVARGVRVARGFDRRPSVPRAADRGSCGVCEGGQSGRGRRGSRGGFHAAGGRARRPNLRRRGGAGGLVRGRGSGPDRRGPFDGPCSCGR